MSIHYITGAPTNVAGKRFLVLLAPSKLAVFA